MKNKNQQKLVLGLVIVLILVIFALLNTEPAKINFGITSIKIPLILLIVILLLIGAVIAYLMGHESKDSISPEELNTQLKEQAESLNHTHEAEVAQLNDQIKDLQLKLDNADQPKIESDSENK